MWVKQFSTMMHQQVGDEEIDDPPEQQIRPWFALAEPTGLTCLQDFYWNGVDHAFIEALVERWTPKTNSFHFYWGDMTITLHDVVCLLGLPIEGRACVAPRQLSRVEVAEMFDLSVASVTTTAANQTLVRKKIRSWILAGGAEEEDRRSLIASTMVAMLLSATCFIDKAGTDIRHEVLSMCLDLEEAATYAWAAGVLACLYRLVYLSISRLISFRRHLCTNLTLCIYRSLGEASRAEAKQLDSCPLLLRAWAGAYFPGRYQALPHTHPERRADPRYAARFLEYRTLPPTAERVLQLRRDMDQLTALDVSISCYLS